MSNRLHTGGGIPWILLLLVLHLSGCLISPPDPSSAPADAIVQMHGAGGEELGVATDYGIVFLGSGQRSGTIPYTVWFGDGPSPESGLVEPLGGGLFLTAPELELHRTALDFRAIPGGAKVKVVLRRGRGVVTLPARVVTAEGVEGLLLAPTAELSRLGPAAIGAGIFIERKHSYALVGLLSGEMRLTRARPDGTQRSARYFTAVGAEELWRLAARTRTPGTPRRKRARPDLGR